MILQFFQNTKRKLFPKCPVKWEGSRKAFQARGVSLKDIAFHVLSQKATAGCAPSKQESKAGKRQAGIGIRKQEI